MLCVLEIRPDYKANRRKSASLPSLYDCVAIDMYASEKKIPHIARCVDIPINSLTEDDLNDDYLPASLIINCMIPSYPLENMVWGRNKEDGVGYSLVFYYVLSSDSRRQLQQRRERIKSAKPAQRYVSPAPSQPNSARGSLGEGEELSRAQTHPDDDADDYGDGKNDDENEYDDNDIDLSPALRLMHRFVKEEDIVPATALRQRFKAITRIVNLESVNCNAASKKLVQSYNGTPFLIKTTSRFYHGPHYFECDVDVHRFSYLARVGLAGVRETLKSVVFDFAFVIEGHSDSELPEQILSAARLSKVDMNSATKFPSDCMEAMENE